MSIHRSTMHKRVIPLPAEYERQLQQVAVTKTWLFTFKDPEGRARFKSEFSDFVKETDERTKLDFGAESCAGPRDYQLALTVWGLKCDLEILKELLKDTLKRYNGSFM